MRTESYNNASISVAPQRDLQAETRDYLIDRLGAATREMVNSNELRNQFHMNNDSAPKSRQELVDRLTSGKFTIEGYDYENPGSKENTRQDIWGFDTHYIIWRDPKGPKPDYDGYHAARDRIYDDSRKTKDIIMVKSADEGLAALEEFKKQNAPSTDTVQ